MTPTTVYVCSSRRIASPITCVARPNDRVHSDSLMRATFGPLAVSSSTVKARPAMGAMPSIGSRPRLVIKAASLTGSPCGGAKLTSVPITPSMAVMVRLSRWKSRKSGTDAGSRVVPVCRSVSHTITSRSSSTTGVARSRTPSTTLKIAVVAPIASASVRTATTVKPGRAASPRRAWRRSAGMRPSYAKNLAHCIPATEPQRTGHRGTENTESSLLDLECPGSDQPASA